jgi:hypothetical protein
MNQLNFNKQDLVARFGEEAKLSEVFSQIEKDLKVINEVVCQFKVNGLALDEQGEKRLSDAQVLEVETLVVHSQSPQAILSNVLRNWSDRLPELIQMNDDLAQAIRFQGVDGQLKNLVDLIDESQLLVDSIMSIDTVFSNLEIVGSEAWKKAQRDMAHGIGEALQAFQKKDFNWLADILEYDMGHSLQTWMELLESLKQDVENKAGSPP